MEIENVPRTVGLIPDGNRRWAKGQRLSLLMGYKLGVQQFVDFSKWCMQYGVKDISVWAFSTENFRRDSKEIEMLFKLYKDTADDKGMLAQLNDLDTKFRIVGNTELLPRSLYRSLTSLEEATSSNVSGVINLLIGYGGRDDIMHAAKEYAKNSLKLGKLYELTDQTFRNLLYSYQVPDIDFVIRTSSEERLSDFLPWQIGYAEFYFSKKLWPDFNKRDLQTALVNYSKRKRRFGK